MNWRAASELQLRAEPARCLELIELVLEHLG